MADRGLCRRLAPCAGAGEDLGQAEVVADVRRGPVGRDLAITFYDPTHREIEGTDDARLRPTQGVVEADQRPGRGSVFDHKRGRDLSSVGVVVGHPVEDVPVIEQADHAAVAGLDVFDACADGPAELLLGVEVRDAVEGAGAADHGIVDATLLDGDGVSTADLRGVKPPAGLVEEHPDAGDHVGRLPKDDRVLAAVLAVRVGDHLDLGDGLVSGVCVSGIDLLVGDVDDRARLVIGKVCRPVRLLEHRNTITKADVSDVVPGCPVAVCDGQIAVRPHLCHVGVHRVVEAVGHVVPVDRCG